jgi:hypothetical protein
MDSSRNKKKVCGFNVVLLGIYNGQLLIMTITDLYKTISV